MYLMITIYQNNIEFIILNISNSFVRYHKKVFLLDHIPAF